MPFKRQPCPDSSSSSDQRTRQKEQGRSVYYARRISTCVIFICLQLYISGSLNAEASSHLQRSPSCGADAYEPNDRRARARNLSYELKHAREITAHLCRQDQDWYTVWLNQGELVEFHVTTPLESPPNIKVFAPRKRKPKGITRRLSPDHRQVRVYAQRSGRYRILVSGDQEERTQYQLYLRRSAPSQYLKR